jgi:hypothetical protein
MVTQYAVRARVDDPQVSAGVGALLRGYLVSQDSRGRYDLHRRASEHCFVAGVATNSCAGCEPRPEKHDARDHGDHLR